MFLACWRLPGGMERLPAVPLRFQIVVVGASGGYIFGFSSSMLAEEYNSNLHT